MLKSDEKIKSVVDSALRDLDLLSNVNKVIGEPIFVGEDVVLPVCRTTVGALVGGGEYGKVSLFKKNDSLPYSAGNGSVVSIKPCGFLIKSGKSYNYVGVDVESFDKIFKDLISFINKVKN